MRHIVSKTRIALIVALLSSATAQSTAPQRLVRIGGIAGEIGLLAFADGRISVYADKTIRIQFAPNPKWKILDHSGSASFEVSGESLRRTKDTLSLAVAKDFQFCDPLNQVDISSTVDKSVSLVLPANSKIKSKEDLRDDLTLVVYSAPNGKVRYDVQVALLQGTSEKQAIVGVGTVSSDGNYCGTESLGGSYRAILIDEPRGSSDFSAAYIYEIRP